MYKKLILDEQRAMTELESTLKSGQKKYNSIGQRKLTRKSSKSNDTT